VVGAVYVVVGGQCACLVQAVGVPDALRVQAVVLGGDHQRRGDAGEVCRVRAPRRRHEPVGRGPPVERVRAAVRALDREQVRRVVAPADVARELEWRHDLDRRDAELGDAELVIYPVSRDLNIDFLYQINFKYFIILII
jgi:hypothetical protein